MNGYFQEGISHLYPVFYNQSPSLHITKKGKKNKKGGDVAQTVLRVDYFTREHWSRLLYSGVS